MTTSPSLATASLFGLYARYIIKKNNKDQLFFGQQLVFKFLQINGLNEFDISCVNNRSIDTCTVK